MSKVDPVIKTILDCEKKPDLFVQAEYKLTIPIIVANIATGNLYIVLLF